MELEPYREFLQKVLDDVRPFTDIIPNLDVIFYLWGTKRNAEKLVEILEYPDFIEDRVYELFLNNTVPFSWGYEDNEFVFIFLETDDPLLTNEKALQGLILHEITHSVQRQRGFEIDLRNSMNFSLPFFTGLAESIPTIDNTKLVESFQDIAKVVVLVLKDLFVNTELVQRGYAPQLCEYYFNLFELRNPDSNFQAPVYDISYTPGKVVDEESLDEFVGAMKFILSLLPSWLTFVKDRKAGYLPMGLTIKHYLFQVFEKNLHIISSEFNFIEDLYLTSFAFTRDFHLEFYTAVFTFVLKFLAGENFDLQHLSNAVEIIAKSTVIPHDRKLPIIIPLLKAGDLIAENYTVQEIYKQKLKEYMRDMISPSDYKEWEEVKDEYEAIDLLLVPLYLILNQARIATVDGAKYHQKMPLIQSVLLILQVLKQKWEQEMPYYRPIRMLAKEYVSEPSTRAQTKLVFKTEMMAKKELFEDYPFDPEIAPMLIDQLNLFYVPITNEILSIIDQLFQLYDATIKKVEDESVMPEVLTLSSSAAFKDASEDIKEFAVPIVRTVLLMIKMKPSLIRKTIDKFGSYIFSIDDTQKETIYVNPIKRLATGEIFNLPYDLQPTALVVISLEEGTIDEIAKESELSFEDTAKNVIALQEMGYIGKKDSGGRIVYFY
jgi:hypothetical protein